VDNRPVNAMFDPSFLELLRCPIDRQPLVMGSEELTQKLNELIAKRQLRDRADGVVEQPIDGLLVSKDGSRAYAIREGIPALIPSEAIELSGLSG